MFTSPCIDQPQMHLLQPQRNVIPVEGAILQLDSATAVAWWDTMHHLLVVCLSVNILRRKNNERFECCDALPTGSEGLGNSHCTPAAEGCGLQAVTGKIIYFAASPQSN